MRVLHPSARVPRARRGAALMLSFLVLIVLILIVQQISYSSRTDARIARNGEMLMVMDQSIESVLLQVYDDLRTDGESGGGGGGGLGAAAAGGDGGGGGDPLGGGGGGPSDSREEGWARPQRTELNDLQLRILVQDEDSKFNVLSIVQEDEEAAQKAFERLVRVIENCRAGTTEEIDRGDAQRIAELMREFMTRRADQILPAPEQLSVADRSPEASEVGLPLTLQDFAATDPELLPPKLFRDYRDEDGLVVHGLGTFLTVHSSLVQGPPVRDESGPVTAAADDSDEEGGGDEGAEQEGGDEEPAGPLGSGDQEGGGDPEPAADGRVNLNTAPGAVLRALTEGREVPFDFWDQVIEYRNEPDEESEDLDPDEVPLDEFGEEIITHQIFESLDGLGEIDGWLDLEPDTRAELRNQLKVSSSVFTIYVTARHLTGTEDLQPGADRLEIERAEEESPGMVRTVRSVVWRRTSEGGEADLVPLIRWQVVDFVPFEVLDFPDEDR